jgi:hypothetical protein
MTSRHLVSASLFLGASYIFYRHSRIHPVTSLRPLSFQSLTTNQSSQKLYERHLDRPLPRTSKSNQAISAGLASFLQAFFTSKPYQFELLVSEAKEDVHTLHFDQLQIGQKIGNLCVESIPSPDEIIFNYKLPGLDLGLFKTADFNYKMYFATPNEDHIQCGFVDYSDDWTQVLGSRLFMQLTMESAARSLDADWIVRSQPIAG